MTVQPDAIRGSTLFRCSRRAAIVSVVLTAASTLLYPGGTFLDPASRGYSLFQNFLSDLGMTVTHGGHQNRAGASLFVTAFAFLVCAIAGCAAGFVRLHFECRETRGFVRAGGIAAIFVGVGLLGAALTPANVSPVLHLRFSLLAICSAPVSLLLYGVAAKRDRRCSKTIPAAWFGLAVTILMLLGARWGPGIDSAAVLALHVVAQKVVAVAVITVIVLQTYQAERIAATTASPARVDALLGLDG